LVPPKTTPTKRRRFPSICKSKTGIVDVQGAVWIFSVDQQTMLETARQEKSEQRLVSRKRENHHVDTRRVGAEKPLLLRLRKSTKIYLRRKEGIEGA
jgi:hypothetical protein